METHMTEHLGKKLTRSAVIALAAGLGLAMTGAAHADEDVWPSLQRDVFDSRPMIENEGIIEIDAPERAEDAAVVPITIRMPPSFKEPIKSMTLVIDKNPAPVAATFTFGPAAGTTGGERRMSTRVRVDSYSYVHAVVETTDGKLHVAKRFVKASGGCSAPAPKDADAETADLGKTLVKSFAPAVDTTPLREGQIMIKHPNRSGLQIDMETRGYIPARFVKDIEVKSGDDLVFRAETGISIASNPNFRFTYANAGDKPLTVTAIDSDETKFSGQTAKVPLSQ